jgi:hypothetical protein
MGRTAALCTALLAIAPALGAAAWAQVGQEQSSREAGAAAPTALPPVGGPLEKQLPVGGAAVPPPPTSRPAPVPANVAGQPASILAGWPLEIGGYLQVDAIPHAESSADELDPVSGEPLNEETVFVRRARLRVAGQRGPVRAEIEFEGDTLRGPQARFLAAHAAYRVRRGRLAAALRAGVFKTPFGAEVPEPVERRWFVEASTAARALFPGAYDAGVALGVEGLGLEGTVAAMAGVPAGESEFAGRDPASTLDLLGRVGGRGPLAPGVLLRAGISALVGEGLHPGEPATKDELTWVDASEDGIVQLSEIQVLSGSAATPSQSYRRFALGADAACEWSLPHLGRSRLSGEIIFASNLDRAVHPADPVALGRDLRELGWQVALEQALGRHALVGARYQRYDPDLDASEQRGVQVTPQDAHFAAWSLLVGARHGDALRLVLQYDRNRNPLGRDPSGAVTTLPADRLTLRAQVGLW